MRTAVCGYQNDLSVSSSTTLTFDQVYDEVRFKLLTKYNSCLGLYSSSFANKRYLFPIQKNNYHLYILILSILQ